MRRLFVLSLKAQSFLGHSSCISVLGVLMQKNPEFYTFMFNWVGLAKDKAHHHHFVCNLIEWFKS